MFQVQHLIARPGFAEYCAYLESALSSQQRSSTEAHADEVAEAPAPAAARTFRGLSLERCRRAFWVAAKHGCKDVIEALLDAGMDAQGLLDHREPSITPLHLAAQQGHVDVVRQLLAAGANVRAFTSGHAMPAHFAAAHSAEALALLLDAGSPPAARDFNRQTLLHYAARAGCTASAALLLARGLVPDINAVRRKREKKEERKKRERERERGCVCV